jgi:transposase-like protein
MTEPMKLLKTDARGRVRTPQDRREAMLDEFERSGATARSFAKLCGVNYQTFATWAQQRRKGRAAAGRLQVPRLVEAVVEAPANTAEQRRCRAVTVHLPGGARMEVGDVGQAKIAALLLRELAAAGGGAC